MRVEENTESIGRKNKHQPRILYPEILSFKNEGKIKIFSNTDWGEFIANRPALQGMLKDILQREGKYRLETWIYIKKRKVSKND